MRRWFWLLIAALLAACSMSTLAPSETPLPTEGTAETPAPTGTAALPTHTPFVMPTPPPAPTPRCENAPRTRLTPGERGRVLDDDPRAVNIRSLPGTSSEIVSAIPVDAIFFVLAGPRCEEGFAWYYIRYERIEGWLAEGDLSSYYVEPYPPAG